MDEKTFFERMDKKFEAMGNLLESVLAQLEEIKGFVQIKSVVKSTLADFSKEPKATTDASKYIIHYNGEDYTYKKTIMCKYCGQHYVGWKTPYTKGDRPIAIDLEGNVLQEGCPKYN